MSGGGDGGGGGGESVGTPQSTVNQQATAPELEMQWLLGSAGNLGPAAQQYHYAKQMYNDWQKLQQQEYSPEQKAALNAWSPPNPTPTPVANYNPTTGGFDQIPRAAEGGIMSLRR